MVPGRSCSTCLDEPERLWRIARNGSKAPVAGLPVHGQDAVGYYPPIDARANGSLLVAWVANAMWSVRADGSVEQLVTLANVPPPPIVLGDWGARILFVASGGTRVQVWVTDGTKPGTTLVTNDVYSDIDDLSYAPLADQAILAFDPGTDPGELVRLDQSYFRNYAQLRRMSAAPGFGATTRDAVS